jgi:hypothetical protein
MPIDAQSLWAEKYAQRFAEAKFKEDVAREEAFTETSHVVCGERLRVMTARDLLILQGIGSPLIYPRLKISPAHVLQFLWALHVDNVGNSWIRAYRRGKMIARVGHIRRSEDPLSDAILEVSRYLGEIFMDAPMGSGGNERPIGACWLAPSMVRLASSIGPKEPFEGLHWGDVPLPRIWQYLKAVRGREEGSKFKDYSPSDKILSDWISEVNEGNKNGL